MGAGDLIKQLRLKKGLTQEELGNLIGVKRAAVNKWETGSVENLKRSTIEKLSAIFGVSPIQLLGLTEAEPRDVLVSLPIVGRISCGNGVLAYEEIEGYEPTPETWLNGGEYFYLRAKGDSMKNARIQDGDLLLIRQQPDVDDGEIAAVLINDQAVLKKVYKTGDTLVLQSENPDYPPIVCDGKEDYSVRIIGKLKRTVITY
ncbi:phage repressor like transcriptional regulator, XRE family [Syntrophobotulus glycolicus DSM 8271]|uniref:Phage repressor like transcriptional regulator, XRE family n=1 Tax=Syntrophobotulus glycolicus (strain DSM 8271 / FlGlyR) TaxID=645991 RepID=F0SXD1_SYNGF|nr:XRE family transcriptional regulator [Syntrophobotulus glycolicus]ADY54677.1 phage repressor like transcriptional regulator, XRE family [Syntrophobotulus glycolicus DSM 8271]